MFEKRLQEYREEKGYTKREFAKIIGVGETFYNMIENGKKNASKNFMIKLVAATELPEEYWFYGISKDQYIDVRENLKSTKLAVDTITKIGNANELFPEEQLLKAFPKNSLEYLLITALKADLEYINEKQKK